MSPQANSNAERAKRAEVIQVKLFKSLQVEPRAFRRGVHHRALAHEVDQKKKARHRFAEAPLRALRALR
jgi:hypothetical protein